MVEDAYRLVQIFLVTIVLWRNKNELSMSPNLSPIQRYVTRIIALPLPYMYFQYMKPHHVGRLKTWHSINTSNLEGHGGQPHGTNHTANDIYEDLFIRKFIVGVFHNQTVPEQGVAILRRYF